MIQGWYCKEKLDASHSKVYRLTCPLFTRGVVYLGSDLVCSRQTIMSNLMWISWSMQRVVMLKKEKTICTEHGNKIHALSWCHILFWKEILKALYFSHFSLHVNFITCQFGSKNHKLTFQLIVSNLCNVCWHGPMRNLALFFKIKLYLFKIDIHFIYSNVPIF